jgi:ribose 5-phosphate isomerase
VLVIEEEKLVPRLGTNRGLPIAVLPFGWTGTLRRIAEVLPGAERRQEFSDDGHVVIDAPIPPQSDPRILAAVVKAIPGVVGRGFFLDRAVEVAVGSPSGVRFL